MRLSIKDILTATGGRLHAGSDKHAVTGVTIDSRQVTDGSLFIPLVGTQCDGHAFLIDALHNGAAAVLAQKGHASLESGKSFPDTGAVIMVDDPLQALGDLAAYWRKRFPIKLIAVTGSNGKTTTKEMAWQILSQKHVTLKNQGNWNNLIGLPLSLFQMDDSTEIALLEMGMSERGEIRRLAEISRPDIGLITNVGPAHLEQLKTIEAIQSAKAELFESLDSSSTAIINADDHRVAGLAGRTQARVVSFGIGQGDIRAENIRDDNCSGVAFDLVLAGEASPVRLNIPGRHSVSNALAAAALAATAGLSLHDIVSGLESFSGVPGRMETITLDDITILNDAYNANPTSMHVSLNVLAGMRSANKRIAVLGDMLELGDMSTQFHEEIGKTVAQLNLDYLFAIGDFSKAVQGGALSGGMDSEHIIICDTLEALSKHLSKQIEPGDALLLKGSRRMNMDKIITLLQQQKEIHC